MTPGTLDACMAKISLSCTLTLPTPTPHPVPMRAIFTQKKTAPKGEGKPPAQVKRLGTGWSGCKAPSSPDAPTTFCPLTAPVPRDTVSSRPRRDPWVCPVLGIQEETHVPASNPGPGVGNSPLAPPAGPSESRFLHELATWWPRTRRPPRESKGPHAHPVLSPQPVTAETRGSIPTGTLRALSRKRQWPPRRNSRSLGSTCSDKRHLILD